MFWLLKLHYVTWQRKNKAQISAIPLLNEFLSWSLNILSGGNFCISIDKHLIVWDSKVHLRTIVCCLKLMMWRGKAAHTDRELTAVFTAPELRFQMTEYNCFTWPWPLRPERSGSVHRGVWGQWRGFRRVRLVPGEPESDSTHINQCGMQSSILKDKRFKVVVLAIRSHECLVVHRFGVNKCTNTAELLPGRCSWNIKCCFV